MRRLDYLAPVLISVLVCTSHAQLRGGVGRGMDNRGDLRVHIVLNNDRNAGGNLLVRLMEGSSNTVVATTYTNDVGQAAIPRGDHW